MFAMYQSSSSTTTTKNFVGQDIRCNQFSGHVFEAENHQDAFCLQQIGDYRTRSHNDQCITSKGTLDHEVKTSYFPKLDEFSALMNSEEFLEYQVCKHQSQDQPQQAIFANKITAHKQQQQQGHHLQQVNLFRAPPSSNENNNNNTTSENSAKPVTDCNIDNTKVFTRPNPKEPIQETLLVTTTQTNDQERRSQYLDKYQLMKETIYQETKSFFYDSYQPSAVGSDNMDTNSNQQSNKGNNNYNNASYRDIYDNMIKQEKPYIEIVEQPAKCSLRFRYKCEGRSAGSLPGINSSADNKTYPSIQIRNYTGRAVVVISCVTKEAPYLAHPHNIVGKEGCKKGICTVVLNNDPNMIKSFSSLGIQCVKRKDIEESLTLRESIHVDPFRNGFAHKLSSSNIDLNVVRLCFQVFIEGSTPNKCDVPLTPVVSDPIHDKKAMSDLVITKLSHCTAPASGGREIILLCDRISRDDIQIRFFEELDGKLIWETYTELSPTDVHKQVAICFKTPKYFNENITQPVSANIQLKRLSDNQVSEPRMFKFLPSESDEDMITRKRAKMNQLNFHHQQRQQHHQQQFQPVACNISMAQNHLQPPLIPKQQQSPRIALHGQHQTGRGSASPQSRIASPVTPLQASSPAAPAALDRRIQQVPSPTPQATVHLNQAYQDNYMIEPLQQQQSSVVRREIIANDGKVVRLVDRLGQHPLAQSSSSTNACHEGQIVGTGHDEINQQQRHVEDSNKAPLGLSLARIDSDQLMRADMAFNPNMNLDLGSNISIHLNGGNGNSTVKSSHAAAQIQ